MLWEDRIGSDSMSAGKLEEGQGTTSRQGRKIQAERPWDDASHRWELDPWRSCRRELEEPGEMGEGAFLWAEGTGRRQTA